MMFYVYAITDRPEAPLPETLGLDDKELVRVVWSDISAVVSAFGGTQLPAGADEVWRHEEVVERLMADRTVLPVRFGTLLASRQQVGDMLSKAYTKLVADIDRVRGHVEIGILALLIAEEDAENQADPVSLCSAAPAARHSFASSDLRSSPADGWAERARGPGTVYLRSKLARQQSLRARQRHRLAKIEEAYRVLAAHASASRLDSDPGNQNAISAAFLVLRDRVMSFQRLVSELAEARRREFAVLCTGPWPPYSFVTACASHDGPATNGSDWRYAE